MQRSEMDQESRAAFAAGRQFDASTQKIAIVVNNDYSLLDHRRNWVEAFLGAQATILVYAEATGPHERLIDRGVKFVDTAIGREDVSLMREIARLLRLTVALLRERPDIVFLIQTRANVLGCTLPLLLRRTRFVRVFGGRGRVFGDTSGGSRLVQLATRACLRLSAHRKNTTSIFQTPSDLEYFATRQMAVRERSRVIVGTGVSVDKWSKQSHAPSTDEPVVVLIARLFKEKGVYDYVDAIRLLRKRDVRARFELVGPIDEGLSTSVSAQEIADWEREGLIRYLGRQENIAAILRECHTLVLPSYHPEGTPRVLLESAAAGVVRIASDIPGCAATIESEVDGILVPIRDPESLARAIERSVTQPELANRLGMAAQARASKEFPVERVVAQVLDAAGVRHR